MAKILVLDRPINIRLPNGAQTRVPNDEVWKATTHHVVSFNGTWTIATNYMNTMNGVVFGGGTTLKGENGIPASISGSAFKIVEV